jgi:hypothetical protein
MQTKSDSVATSLLAGVAHDTLYQLVFVGGPFGGRVETSQAFPAPRVKLCSGTVEECGTQAGAATTDRRAQYRLMSTRVRLTQPSLIVECRYKYRGTAAS